MFKSAKLFVARLTEVEKTRIRALKTEDGLRWLFFALHRSEIAGSDAAGLKLFAEARDLILTEYQTLSASDQFGRTWAF